jgi:hypothetical protein
MNVNQRNFARLAAQGMKLTEAHERVYGKGKGKRKTKSIEASRLAAKPDVKAAITQYEAQLAPIGDLRECKLRMLANIQFLAYHSPDQKVRLAASIDLRNYIEEREQREGVPRNPDQINVETLLAELADLRHAQPATLELETVSEGEPGAQEAPAEVEESGLSVGTESCSD